MSKRGPVKFAYAVLAVDRKADPSLDLSHAPAGPRIGDILVFPEDHGRIYIREDDYGTKETLVDIVHLHFIGTGRQDATGNVDFEYETRRLLALIQIGANAERVLHAEVDRVFERVQEVFYGLTGGTASDEMLERLRKDFA